MEANDWEGKLLGLHGLWLKVIHNFLHSIFKALVGNASLF